MPDAAHQITVKLGFDGEGFEKAMRAWLAGLVERGEARYDEATRDRIIAHAEEISGHFVKTETFTVSPA